MENNKCKIYCTPGPEKIPLSPALYEINFSWPLIVETGFKLKFCHVIARLILIEFCITDRNEAPPLRSFCTSPENFCTSPWECFNDRSK